MTVRRLYNIDIAFKVRASKIARRKNIIIQWTIKLAGDNTPGWPIHTVEYPDADLDIIVYARSLLFTVIDTIRRTGITPIIEYMNKDGARRKLHGILNITYDDMLVQVNAVTRDYMVMMERLSIDFASDLNIFIRYHYSQLNPPLVESFTPPSWPPAPGRRTVYGCDVVIPYTAVTSQWLPQAVESILNQNCINSIIHMICDGPPIRDDPAQQYCHIPHVRWYRNQPSVGPYISTHRVWHFMETDFFAIQDSDDISLPNRLWYSIETLESVKGDIFGAAMEQFVSHDAGDKSTQSRLQVSPLLRSGGVKINGALLNGTMVCRREAFEQVNGFMSLRCAADTEFIWRARHAGLKIVSAPHVLALRRLHRNSLSAGPEYGENSTLRGEIRTYINQTLTQYARPGANLSQYGGLERDKDNPNITRLDDVP